MRARLTRLSLPFVLGAFASAFTCAAAQAQTSPSTTKIAISAKLWHASWLSYVPASYTGIGANGAPAKGDSVNAVEADAHADVLPALVLSHGKFFASASYGRFERDFHVLTSPVVIPTGQTLITSRTDHFKRRESDLNLGYLVTPEVGIVLGYKDATETRDTTLGIAPQRTPVLTTEAKGLLLGGLGNFAVHDKLRLYVQAGYGPARVRVRFADSALGTARTRGRYLIGELGLSYPVLGEFAGLGGATAAIGYRTQTVKTNSDAGIFDTRRDLRDVRDGLILSLNITL